MSEVLLPSSLSSQLAAAQLAAAATGQEASYATESCTSLNFLMQFFFQVLKTILFLRFSIKLA